MGKFHMVKTEQIPFAVAALPSLLLAATPASAGPNSFTTSRGPAFISGNVGSVQTTTIRGSSTQSLLTSNYNETSTPLVLGALLQAVATRR
jgi:hypothetical protein